MKVVSRFTDTNGEIKGSNDPNPFLNNLNYDVELPDGEIKEYLANVIAENMYPQVDDDSHATQILYAIVDYRKDRNAVNKADMRVSTKSGEKNLRHTASSWSLLIMWKSREEEWMLINHIKQSLSLKPAEFSVTRRIHNDPAFK